MIKLTQVSLRRGPRMLFDGADLTVHQGQRTGVTGANGIGKSSLFAMLQGELQADSGEISLPPRIEVASVSQEVRAVDDSAIDYVIAGDRGLVAARAELAAAELADDGNRLALAHETIDQIDGYSADTRAAKLLAGLGFSEAEQQQSFAAFSGGWRMRLNLARALMCRSDLLLLDEPMAGMNVEEKEDMSRFILDVNDEFGTTIVLIEHDMGVVMDLSDRIVVLDYGKKIGDGTPAEIRDNKEVIDAYLGVSD